MYQVPSRCLLVTHNDVFRHLHRVLHIQRFQTNPMANLNCNHIPPSRESMKRSCPRAIRTSGITCDVRKTTNSERASALALPFLNCSDSERPCTPLSQSCMKAFQNPDEVGAAAVPYLRVVGHLVYSYFFAQMAKIALSKQDSGDNFYKTKLATARFYFARLLPETAMLIRQARSGSANLMELDADLF